MQTWACVGRLAAHTLSVTQLAFSNDGRHLLSGSRDRSFAVFRRQDDPQPGLDVCATCNVAFCIFSLAPALAAGSSIDLHCNMCQMYQGKGATDACCRAAAIRSAMQSSPCPSAHDTECGLGAWRRSICYSSTGCDCEAVDHGGSRSCTCVPARSNHCMNSNRASADLVHAPPAYSPIPALHRVSDCMQAQHRSRV